MVFTSIAHLHNLNYEEHEVGKQARAVAYQDSEFGIQEKYLSQEGNEEEQDEEGKLKSVHISGLAEHGVYDVLDAGKVFYVGSVFIYGFQ